MTLVSVCWVDYYRPLDSFVVTTCGFVLSAFLFVSSLAASFRFEQTHKKKYTSKRGVIVLESDKNERD